MELKKTLKLDAIMAEANAATLLDDEDLVTIGRAVVDEFQMDDESRADRKQAMVEANKLAMLVKGEKTSPWPGASNVKFPLLTIAALQFSARAYPALISGTEVVKVRTIGEDQQGAKAQRAKRVAQHMSYQVLEQDEHWEEEMDRLLMTLPIAGTVIKKTYQNTVLNKPVSCMVMPLNFVVPYYTKSVEEAERKTEILFLTPREIALRGRQGTYLEVELGTQNEVLTAEMRELFQERGLNPATNDPEAPRVILEQHRFIDLDGDGFQEPYCVTVDMASGKVLRIYAEYTADDIQTDKDREIAEVVGAGTQMLQAAAQMNDAATVMAIQQQMADDIQSLKKKARIINIKAIEYYTKYSFIPSPDGSFYDLGFGDLLLPINESVNTLINQLIDSGTLQNSSSGFLGRGAKIKGGDVKFKPFEWKRIDTPGSDLASNIVPLPVNSPSPVLFELLSLLISYSNRLSAVSDMMTGETPGQNTPASVALSSLEQGLKVYTGVFKRVYRSMKSEFQKIYRLNSMYLEDREYFTVLDTGESSEIVLEDYRGDATDVVPAADPTVASDELNLKRAEFIAARAASVPGYNLARAEHNLLKAMKVPEVDLIYPLTEDGQMAIPPPPNPEVQQMESEERRRTAEAEFKVQAGMAKLGYEIANLEANVALTLAKAQSEAQKPDLEAANLALDSARQRLEALTALMQHSVEKEKVENDKRKAEKTKTD